jgi:hypothetical protein
VPPGRAAGPVSSTRGNTLVPRTAPSVAHWASISIPNRLAFIESSGSCPIRSSRPGQPPSTPVQGTQPHCSTAEPLTHCAMQPAAFQRWNEGRLIQTGANSKLPSSTQWAPSLLISSHILAAGLCIFDPFLEFPSTSKVPHSVRSPSKLQLDAHHCLPLALLISARETGLFFPFFPTAKQKRNPASTWRSMRGRNGLSL